MSCKAIEGYSPISELNFNASCAEARVKSNFQGTRATSASRSKVPVLQMPGEGLRMPFIYIYTLHIYHLYIYI